MNQCLYIYIHIYILFWHSKDAIFAGGLTRQVDDGNHDSDDDVHIVEEGNCSAESWIYVYIYLLCTSKNMYIYIYLQASLYIYIVIDDVDVKEILLRYLPYM